MKQVKPRLVQISIVIIIVAAVGWTFSLNNNNRPQSLKLQQSLPHFEHMDMNSVSRSLEDFKGQPMLINFWATWCTPCINELPLLNEAQKFAPNVKMIAINMGDSAKEISRFVNRYELSMVVLQDQELYWRNSFAVKSYPLTLLVNRNGEITNIKEGELTNFSEIVAMLQELEAS